MAKILVTGGSGYIGSHTILDLSENGFEVISLDNFSRGDKYLIQGVSAHLKKEIKNYPIDLCHIEDVRAVFEENRDIQGVIHFAAYKSVPESVEKPLMYFRNNLVSLINVLEVCKEFKVNHFVFSSSCSVYGNTKQLPVTEDTPLAEAESPYARTKIMGENICKDFVRANPGFHAILLRYFNPVGAHPTAFIGELNKKPENLVPVITQTAIGKRESMTVFGNDYDTRDGSCIRDYIHVSDIAHAHTLAVNKSLGGELPNECEIFNLGTGNGVTVLELIKAFEKESGVSLNYKIGSRRAGDVIAIFANNHKAEAVLGWEPRYGVSEMMASAWRWEKYLDKCDKAHLN